MSVVVKFLTTDAAMGARRQSGLVAYSGRFGGASLVEFGKRLAMTISHGSIIADLRDLHLLAR